MTDPRCNDRHHIASEHLPNKAQLSCRSQAAAIPSNSEGSWYQPMGLTAAVAL